MEKPIENTEAKAWIYSIAVYAAFLLALYFTKILYVHQEEEVAFGVDLNYGVDLVGSGDIQTTNKANDSKNAYDVKPEGSEKPDPVKTEKIPATPKKEVPPKAVKTPPSKILTAEEDSKVTVKKSNTEAKKTNNPQTSTAPPVKAVPAEPKRSVDNGSIMKKSGSSAGASGSNGTTGTRDGVGGNNNGDGTKGEVGDKGDPRGTPDGKSLYGNPGKGGSGTSGTSVSISGWKNKGSLSINKDQSNETGTIIFDVVINDFGDVINIKNRPTSISPSVIGYYREQIRTKLKSTLQPEGTPPSRSSGTITIRITRG